MGFKSAEKLIHVGGGTDLLNLDADSGGSVLPLGSISDRCEPSNGWIGAVKVGT